MHVVTQYLQGIDLEVCRALIPIRKPLWLQPSSGLNGTFQTMASTDFFEGSSTMRRGWLEKTERGEVRRRDTGEGKKRIAQLSAAWLKYRCGLCTFDGTLKIIHSTLNSFISRYSTPPMHPRHPLVP